MTSLNVDRFAVRVQPLTACNGSGIGCEIGVSAQLNVAVGRGSWTGILDSANASSGFLDGSVLWTPGFFSGQGPKAGASCGARLGVPPVRACCTHPTYWCSS